MARIGITPCRKLPDYEASVTRAGADAQAVLRAAQATLRESHGIEHATLQVEVTPAEECHSATW